VKRFRFTKAISSILIGGVLAGGALVFGYMQSRVQTPSTWRSLYQPVRDNSAEEYAVYSTIIDKLHHEDRLRVFVLRDHTAPCVRMDEWCTQKQVRNRLPNLRPETLDDYLIQNEKSAALSESFNLQPPAVMLSDQDLPELLVKTKLQFNFSPLPGSKIQWGKFYDRYPLSPGLISLSRVGFDPQINQALVYEEILGNADGTWGRYLVLTKESGRWLIEDKIESYFPEEPLPSVKHGEWGTLKGHILDAKAEGLDEVQLSVLACGWDIGSLREALARDTVMLAEVVGKKTFADQYDLRTWYRFKVIDTFSEKPMPKYLTYSSLPDPPKDIQPLREDEFVMLETNGQMEIDGVRVTQYSNGVVYSVGDTYLIFLHLDPSKRVAVRSATDPLGVFLVGKDGTFRAYLDEPYTFRDQMARRFGNSIEKLRKSLKN
jgi:hypothetical protein